MALDVPARTVPTTSGRSFTAEAVVLATGLRQLRHPGWFYACVEAVAAALLFTTS